MTPIPKETSLGFTRWTVIDAQRKFGVAADCNIFAALRPNLIEMARCDVSATVRDHRANQAGRNRRRPFASRAWTSGADGNGAGATDAVGVAVPSVRSAAGTWCHGRGMPLVPRMIAGACI